MEDGDAEDAVGTRFGEERFVVGEYVSLSRPQANSTPMSWRVLSRSEP